MSNNGYFSIPADQLDGSSTYLVPKELVGETPNGSANPEQESYDAMSIDSRRDTRVLIRIVGDMDEKVNVVPVDSHFADPELDEANDLESSVTEVGTGDDQEVFNYDSQGGRYFGVRIETKSSGPTTGNLKIIFEAYER